MKGLIFITAVLLLTSACGKKSFDLPPADEQFIQGNTYNTKVDIVMMIDNSSSMAVHQNRLAQEIPQMINALNKAGLDWHIGITSSDMNGDGFGDGGYLIGEPAFISAQTANGLTMLQQRIQLGEMGSNLERGLDSVKSVMKLNNLNAYAPGFYRDDALLAVIFLTDEKDHSQITPTEFVNFMDQIKRPFPSGERSWTANLIGTLALDPNCTANGFLSSALYYIDVVKASNGVEASICTSSLAQAVQNVKVRMLEFTRDFRLERKPLLSSIRVYINGVLIPESNSNGWKYIDSTQAIRFYGDAIPEGDDKIKIDYDPAEAT
jgi:hypothetical protein